MPPADSKQAIIAILPVRALCWIDITTPTIATPKRPALSPAAIVQQQSHDRPSTGTLKGQSRISILSIFFIAKPSGTGCGLTSECIVMKVGKLDYLGGFAGDALGHHLDCLRYLEDDRRHSNFRERLHRIGCSTGVGTETAVMHHYDGSGENNCCLLHGLSFHQNSGW
jgi:hypothetical protein